MRWEDDVTAKHFVERLTVHRKVLADAKEKLRTLLKESFSVKELLFQSDTDWIGDAGGSRSLLFQAGEEPIWIASAGMSARLR